MSREMKFLENLGRRRRSCAAHLTGEEFAGWPVPFSCPATGEAAAAGPKTAAGPAAPKGEASDRQTNWIGPFPRR